MREDEEFEDKQHAEDKATSQHFDDTEPPSLEETHSEQCRLRDEIRAEYHREAIDKEIAKDESIGPEQAKAIHSLLKGRSRGKETN